MRFFIRLILSLSLGLAAPVGAGGFKWPFSAPAADQAGPATVFPFFSTGTPSTARPYGAATYGPASANPLSVFAATPAPLGGYGFNPLNDILASMMVGAMSFAIPFVGNYAIASLNPTTFSNFMSLMLRSQSSPFGSPFGGGFFFGPASGGFPGFGMPARPSSTFPIVQGFGL